MNDLVCLCTSLRTVFGDKYRYSTCSLRVYEGAAETRSSVYRYGVNGIVLDLIKMLFQQRPDLIRHFNAAFCATGFNFTMQGFRYINR